MKQFEEFTREEKNFIYIDLSGYTSYEDFKKITDSAARIIAGHPKNSLYTITNIEGLKFDTRIREIALEYLKSNKPYTKYGAVVGMDGIKKIMLTNVFKLSGRKNMFFALSIDHAIEWLLKQD